MAKDPRDRIGTVEKILCARCKVMTDHIIRDSYKTSWSDDEHDVDGGATHDFMACNGCQSATYRLTSWFSEEPGNSVSYWPPRGEAQLSREPRDFENIPYGSPLESVYRQTIAACNSQLSTLAGAGVRLLIEGICNEQGIKKGDVTDDEGVTKKQKNLEGKINGMVEHGLIGKKQADVLHEIRFLGNDAAHELDQPSRRVLSKAIDIVEHILAQVYEHPEDAKFLAGRKRPKKN